MQWNALFPGLILHIELLHCTVLPWLPLWGLNLHFLSKIASLRAVLAINTKAATPLLNLPPHQDQQKKRFTKIMCNESSAALASPPPSFHLGVGTKSNFLFFSCYFWKQFSDLKDCHAQKMCFGSSASCILWMIRSNRVAARWLINLLQNNRSHWRINNAFIVSPQWSVWNFLS